MHELPNSKTSNKIPPQCFDTYGIWNNIITTALYNDVSLPKIIVEIIYLIENDDKFHNRVNFDKMFIILNILAEKLKCHVADLFNTDVEWTRTRLYKFLQNYESNEPTEPYTWDFDDDPDEKVTRHKFMLPDNRGTFYIAEKEVQDSGRYVYTFEYSLVTAIFDIANKKNIEIDFSTIRDAIYMTVEVYWEEDGKVQEYFDVTGRKARKMESSGIIINGLEFNRMEITPSNAKIDVRDFVVRTNIFNCTHNEHYVENIEAEFTIIDDSDTWQSVKVPAGYCRKCNTYFIIESTYQDLKSKGIVLCRICDNHTYRTNCHSGNMKLAKESILHQYGYNVGREEGLSEMARRRILSTIIDNHILSKTEIIGYLGFFISQHQSPVFKSAVSKWNEDRYFVERYKMGTYTQYQVNELYRD